jgi:hypothetical protein
MKFDDIATKFPNTQIESKNNIESRLNECTEIKSYIYLR